MKVALVQLNTVVGDFDENLHLAEERLDEARRLGADLVVYPELTFSGYPPRDLLEKNSYIQKNLEVLHRFKKRTNGIAAVVGYITRNPNAGKALYNSAALVADGRIVHETHKCLLPTYDVFDEARHFAGCPRAHGLVEYGGRRLGILICEDFWNDADMFRHRLYSYDPVEDLANRGAEILININASPFTMTKPALRERLVAHAARKYGAPVVMVNQVGGYDEILFDGHSLVADAAGTIIARSPGFVVDVRVVDLDAPATAVPGDNPPFAELAFRALVMGTREYTRKSGFTSVVIGLSGGIDSSLVAAIAVEALGADNVLGVAMPSHISSAGSVTDARALAANLGIRLDEVPIAAIYDAFLTRLEPLFAGRPFDTAEENLQARIRGNILMALSNKFGHLVLSTGNKSELAVGYSTLYGDMCGGLAVIADLLKTKVYELAQWINRRGEVIPAAILAKPPSAELREGQTDQDDLPPYEVLDAILARYIEEQLSMSEIIAAGFDAELVRRIIMMVDRNEYKRRQAPPALKITGKAFGPGRQLPIIQRFNYRKPLH